MTPRIQELLRSLEAVRAGQFPVSVEKGVLMTEAFERSEGQPQIIRCARAFAHVLDNIPIYLEPNDLFAGNLCSKRGGVELSCLWSVWNEDELDALNAGGFQVSDEDRPRIRAMNEYWRARSMTSRMTSLYDDARLWPYAQLGVVLPAFRSREEGWGPGGMLGVGWGVHHEISQIIGVFQFEKVLGRGLESLIAEAQAELADTRIYSRGAVEKVDMLKGVIIALDGIIRYANRFAALATESAAGEKDAVRRAALLQIAEMCARVPARPARNFREAMQAVWFTSLMILPSGVMSFGRFDQLLYPYYESDLAAGAITEDQALEILQWLRIRDSQIVITAGQTHRKKYGGLAKWHNCVIGGQTRDGADATNPLTYLILKAAQDCPAPHPTLTMRVHEATPEPLLRAALDLVATGVGLPALISDRSCIDFLLAEGVSLEDARDYAVAGCLGVNIAGRSRTIAWPMFAAPLVFEFAMHGGVDPRTGRQVGPVTPTLAAARSYEEFRDGVYTQLAYFLGLHAEFNNVTMQAYAERFPQTVETALSEGLLQSGRNVLGNPLPFENGSCLNPIGMINVADSLAAVRKIVFDDRKATGDQLMSALAANWRGADAERLREIALGAPKYGNDDDYADRIAADLYDFWANCAVSHTTVYGGRFKAAAITIGTCVVPGGAHTGATPDGRARGEPLADESLSPMRGRDKSGLAAMLNSAAKIDQSRWQAMSLDVRFSPKALAEERQVTALASMIRDYFRRGGKHIQFNAVGDEDLRAARRNPEAQRDLIVRIGGCSAYFAQLSSEMQEEIIRRTEFSIPEEGVA